MRHLFLAAALIATPVYADLGVSLGSSSKYGTSVALGIYGDRWGVEIGGTQQDDTRQHPGNSLVKEAPRGLDVVYRFGDGSVRPYAGVGTYFWQETTLTPGAGAIVFEEKETHLLLTGSFGLWFKGSGPFSFAAGYHTIRGPNASFIYNW